ncbi:MAG TPA: tetratricopeptide repeat protein [Bacteroidota bacterium]|nr:tetratricopeptide repeat protein [Bacteroidota bacterium]
MTDRLETLRKFLEEDPSDPFNRYALALEYVSRRDFSASAKLFEEVIGMHPDYIPAYQQLGMLMKELGRTDRAKSVLEEGVRRAVAAGDGHAAAEMREMIDETGV